MNNPNVSIEKTTETIRIYCYKYIWKNKNGRLCVKYLTETQDGHALFQEHLRESEEVVSAMREYVHEINFTYINFTEPVKEEKKDDESEI